MKSLRSFVLLFLCLFVLAATAACGRAEETTLPPPDGETTISGGQFTTEAPLTDDTTAAGPADDTTAAGPADDTTTADPADDTTAAGPADDTTTADPGDDTTTADPTDDTTVADPTVTTTVEPPETTTVEVPVTSVPETVAPVTYTAENWMSVLPDETKLSTLSIPGSHESCARVEPLAGSAVCQTLSVAEQLAAGVRYLDIRCRRVDNAFAIYHGMVSQNLTFDEVLADCYLFLERNPGETLILCVKEEYDPKGENDSFEAIFKRYVAASPERWYTKASIPTLGEVRGKIVLIRRFSASGVCGFPAASGWADNQTFTIHSGSEALKVQDYYNVTDGAAKWRAVEAFFQASLPDPNTYYLNNTSGYKAGLFGIPKIPEIAEYVNPLAEDYLKEHSGFVGITAFDFVTPELAFLVIERNFS